MRLLELDSARQEVRILFPYDKRLVELVRELPGRRWNADGKYWSVPPQHAGEVFRRLREFGFVASPELAEWLRGGSTADFVRSEESAPAPAPGAGSAGEFAAGRANSAPDEAGGELLPSSGPKAPACSVSWLNRAVREVLSEAFPAPLWLQGEIHGFDRNRHKKHIYFQLADRDGDDDRPAGVVTAVLFSGSQEIIAQRLRSAPDPFELQDGLRIRVLVRVDLYPPSGSYQVVIEDLDPYFTLGEIARRQEQILAEVRRRGLLDANRLLPFPRPTLRIGLVTSFDSDAYNDFVNELERSGFAFEVDTIDCHVQGARVEFDVLGALRYFAERASSYDVVAIVRGGGSKTDLLGFDSLPLALAVAEHPVKVLVGIGHHRDRSVLDALAHSEKTPTAVAQVIVGLVRAEEQALREAARSVVNLASEGLRRERERRSRASLLLARSLQLALERARAHVRARAQRLHVRAGRRIEREQQRCGSRARLVVERACRGMERRRDRMQRRLELLPSRARESLRRASDLLERRGLQVRSADPRRVLARGYAWLRNDAGESIKSIGQVTPDQRVVARLADGDIEARVVGASGPTPSDAVLPPKRSRTARGRGGGREGPRVASGDEAIQTELDL